MNLYPCHIGRLDHTNVHVYIECMFMYIHLATYHVNLPLSVTSGHSYPSEHSSIDVFYMPLMVSRGVSFVFLLALKKARQFEIKSDTNSRKY